MLKITEEKLNKLEKEIEEGRLNKLIDAAHDYFGDMEWAMEEFLWQGGILWQGDDEECRKEERVENLVAATSEYCDGNDAMMEEMMVVAGIFEEVED